MAEYETKAFSVGDVTVTASKAKGNDAADRLEAVLKWLGEQITDPGYGRPEGRPDRPDQGLPGSGGRPDQGLPPSAGHPDQDLPGRKPRPDQDLPGSGGRPDQGLPGEGGERPDQGLPGSGGRPDQGLPGEMLGKFLKEKAKEIAAAILKDTACDPAKPKGR